MALYYSVKNDFRGIWLAQSMDHVTLDLGIEFDPHTLGIELTSFKK